MATRLTESRLRRIIREEAHRLSLPHRRLREAAGEQDLAAAKAAAAEIWPGQEFSIWLSQADGTVYAAGAVTKGTPGSYYDWDQEAGQWVFGMGHVLKGPVPPQPHRGLRRGERIASLGPFRSLDGQTFGFDELLGLLKEDLGDDIIDDPEGEGQAIAEELVEDFLVRSGLADRVSGRWLDAATSTVMSMMKNSHFG